MYKNFPHRHLLDIQRLSPSDINAILDLTKTYVAQNRSAKRYNQRLLGKTVVNMFFEASTRTRNSFEIAAKRLGADVVNVDIENSSVRKGETLLDTVLTLNAMQVDAFVIRHSENGIAQFIAPHVQGSVLNAGDGSHEHPTQALLDAATILRHKPKLEGLEIAICGDIEHSRVARSNINLLNKFGAKVRIIAPAQFMPRDLSKLGVTAYDDMANGMRDVDVVMMLRIQHERLSGQEFEMSVKEYHQTFGLNHAKLKLAKPDVIVMHPLPMNRGVEISSELADDPSYSVLFEQMEMGVAVRMACLDLLLANA